ncbi:MAG TPA: carbon-nitrogen hydrolase family protein, partial [Bacillota bacterium]
MGDVLPRYRVAAVHAAPVFMDREASVEKACGLIAEAAARGAALVAFPEVFLPGYPLWCLLAPPYENHDLYRLLYRNALTVPGPEVDELCRAARRHSVYVSVGINEKSPDSPGTLWNANLLIDADGRLIGHRRKLVPTFAEKLVWSNGDARDLQAHETDLGRIGVLICGENTNPLARFALLAQGEQLHIATYPCAFPAKKPGAPGEYDLGRAIEIRSAAHSFEGKVYTVVTAGFVDDRTLEISARWEGARQVMAATPRPASMVLAPDGRAVAGPVTDAEGLVLADVDLENTVEEKQIHDVTGGYNRFDVFRLEVRREKLAAVRGVEGGSSGGRRAVLLHLALPRELLVRGGRARSGTCSRVSRRSGRCQQPLSLSLVSR